MITHVTLYNLANNLGALSMFAVVLYHVVAVHAKYVSKNVVGAAS